MKTSIVSRLPFLRIASLAVLSGAIVLGSSTALAQEARTDRWEMAPRVYGYGQLGLFGDVDVRSRDDHARDSLLPSGGAGGGFELPIAHAFSIGGEAGFWSWNSDGAADWDVGPSTLVDLSAVPRLRLPWSAGPHSHGAIGLAIPVGPTASFLNGDAQRGFERFGARIDTGVGMHIGALLNGQFFFVEQFGVTFDLGYVHHVVWHEVDGLLGRRTVQVDMGQLVIRLGVVVAL